MRTLAVLPVKSFSRAKRRLGDEVARELRESLVEAMLRDVLDALKATDAVDAVVVVTAGEAPARIAREHGADVMSDMEQGHNPAAALGIGAALRDGYDRALLVPGDCPAIDPSELDALLERGVVALPEAGAAPQVAAAPSALRSGPTASPSALIVPDRHGTGTNGLVNTPPAALMPSFGPGSCERHAVMARALGVQAEVVEVPSLALDIDTPDDLAALASVPHGAAHTHELLSRC